MTAADDLEAAIRARAIECGGMFEGQYVVAWTLVGECVDPDQDDGVQVFSLSSDPIDPFAELGLLTMRQRYVEDHLAGPGDESS